MIDQRTEQPRCPNGGHEWRTITEIGDWIHNVSAELTVRDLSLNPDLWDEGRCDLSYDELRLGIESAGGVGCTYALHARTSLDGAIVLSNGVHGWAVAQELGIDRVPVQMYYEPDEPGWARW